MKKGHLIIWVIIPIILLVIFVVGALVKYFYIGEVKKVSTISVENINVTDVGIEFDIDSIISADMYKGYTLRVKEDRLYIKIHTVLTTGYGVFERRLTIPFDLSTINEVYIEDKENEQLIWSRTS